MNREQFIAHVERTQESLRRFLTALCCGNASLADDLAQETLIRAWLSCESFREDAAFATWIRRIAYNLFINSRRCFKESARLDIPAAQQAKAREESDSAFRYEELYMALSELTMKERTSILLYYMEGYSTKEIAAIEDSTEAAIKQHLSRGRNHLRKLINTPA